jgi:hypothetical protein
MASVLGLYVKRWQRWVAAGLQGFKVDVGFIQKLESMTGMDFSVKSPGRKSYNLK